MLIRGSFFTIRVPFAIGLLVVQINYVSSGGDETVYCFRHYSHQQPGRHSCSGLTSHRPRTGTEECCGNAHASGDNTTGVTGGFFKYLLTPIHSGGGVPSDSNTTATYVCIPCSAAFAVSHLPRHQPLQPQYHGTWLPWSAWGSCSSTCGSAVRSRSRVCYETARHDIIEDAGNMVAGCVGDDLQVERCDALPLCAVDGGWSSWTEWSPCRNSKEDNHQQQSSSRVRRRECNKPSPNYGGSNCTGNSIQTRTCTEIVESDITSDADSKEVEFGQATSNPFIGSAPNIQNKINNDNDDGSGDI